LWHVQVHKDRDLWLHIEKIKFSSRSCEDGRLEFYLPHNGGAVGAAVGAEPWMRICGENVSHAKDIPIVTNAELLNTDFEAVEDNLLSSSIFIHFYGRLPARSAFKLAWTELFHLPRNSDGTVATQRLSADCEFLCPGKD
jgi:hypothetical protein